MMDSNVRRKRKLENYIFIANKGTKVNDKCSQDSELLVVRRTPQDKKSLCVNSKKVTEVETWLNAALDDNNSNASRILILTGPSGAGKTATIYVLCKEFGVTVKEFDETSYCVEKNEILDEEIYDIVDPLFVKESQLSEFKKFFLEAASTLETDSKRRLILIEEFQTEFKRDPSPFLVIVKKFITSFSVPIVFIVNSPSSTDLSLCKFFPPHFLQETNATEIVFNSVTIASIVSVLSKICNDCVSKEELKRFAETCGGDIRNAVNTFEVKYGHLLKDVDFNVSKRKGKKVRFQLQSDVNVCGRECCPSFFHILGKIMYCKRSNDLEKSSSLLPPHLRHCARKELKENAEEMVDSLTVSKDTLDLYLHEHYIKFCTDLQQVSTCVSLMSDLDASFGQIGWQSSPTFSRVQNYTNVRNLMFNLSKDGLGKRNSFYSFTKPKFSNIWNKYRQERLSLARSNNFVLHSFDEYNVNVSPYVSLMSDTSKESMNRQNGVQRNNIKHDSKASSSYLFNSSIEMTSKDESMYAESEDEIMIEDFEL